MSTLTPITATTATIATAAPLALPDFATFFQAVHGQAPFPWQTRAAALLVQRRTAAVTVPTGMGKSALIDAAVWAAAHGAWRRIAFVVDRRIVVDAVHQRALKIRQVLAQAADPALQVLAVRLGEMQVERLRGGVHGDDDWVLYPERLSVLLTTVDQLGSRLLFRGYGVSPRRWPLHAAFCASDTLIVIDEAHLSAPFLQTLQTLRDHGAAIDVLPMTATPPAGWQGGVIGLDPDDLAVPAIHQRLQAAKPAVLVETGPGDDDLVRAALDAVQRLAAVPGVRRLLVVLNRVATARRCFEQLGRLSGPGLGPCEATLITGRVRQAERDEELARMLPRVQTGSPRHPDDPLLVVVATQTVEVGADLDLDALVTESAPLSALRQRFGRIDRLGLRGRSDAVVLHRALKEGKDDPVYGPALAAAWAWLRQQAVPGAVVDFGLHAFDALLRRAPAPAEPVDSAATLLPVHLQMLAQTGEFAPELDISAWLHGPRRQVPDVTLVWRADLDALAPSQWPHAAALLPPLLREGLPMPAPAVRRWLSRGRPGDIWHDAAAACDDTGSLGSEPDRLVLRWRGADDCSLIAVQDVAPGDTLILPAGWGGCDAWGWAPASTAPVRDLADTCQLERRRDGAARRLVLRLAPGVWDSFGAQAGSIAAQVAALRALQAQALTADEDLDDEIDTARAALVEAVCASTHPLAAGLRDPRLEPHPGGFVLGGRGIDEDDSTVETGRAVALDVHLADVGRWAARLAQGEVPVEAQTGAVVGAALVHDAGKAEPRMQALLHGSPAAAAQGPLLAKSGLRRADQRLAALKRSGLPRGFRHEFASLAMTPPLDALTRHLVATHHGHGRPWLRPCDDAQAPGAEFAHLQAHWLQQWAQLQAQHGPWVLARLEWLLRAADARASIEEAGDD